MSPTAALATAARNGSGSNSSGSNSSGSNSSGSSSSGPSAGDPAAGSGFGLLAMRLRTEGVAGTLEIESWIAELSRLGVPARVLVLTTYDTDSDVVRAIEAGGTGYLLKDSPRAELLRAVQAAARGAAALSPSVATRLLCQVLVPAQEPLSQREFEVLELGVSDRAADVAGAFDRGPADAGDALTHVRFGRLPSPHPDDQRRHEPCVRSNVLRGDPLNPPIMEDALDRGLIKVVGNTGRRLACAEQEPPPRRRTRRTLRS
jgi:CheY-like chemotaxis protein